jgi:type 2 lantibiotic biosynthesis protein LanM
MPNISHLSEEQLRRIAAIASSLWERIDQGFAETNSTHNTAAHKASPAERTQADARLKEWRDLISEGNQALFAERLARDGLEEASVRFLLGHAPAPATGEPPAWCRVLNEVLQAMPALRDVALSPRAADSLPYLRQADPLPFEELFLPFVEVGCERLRAGSCAPLPDTIIHLFARALLTNLSQIAARVLAVEFRAFLACRQFTGQSYIDVKAGKDSRTQYLSFIADFYEEGFAPLFEDYCVLGRLLATALLHWVESLREFQERLNKDRSEIETVFNHRRPTGAVVALKAGLSDPHDGGRSVIAVEFTCGLKLIYKPKGLALEKSYFHFAAWINRFEALLPFRLLTILDQGHYGWVECVEHQSCTHEDQIRRYYRRSGIFLCLVYAFNGSDFHYENLIADGENPVPIDLETIFHHQAKAALSQEPRDEMAERLANSVLVTDLLPDPVKVDHQYFDISALARSEAEEGEPELLIWKHINTDGMDYDYARKKPAPAMNLPMLNGNAVSIDNYADCLLDGFKEAYEFLVKHKDELLDESGPLRLMFAHDARFIFRSTAFYALLLKIAFHPAYLRDGIDLSLQFDVLARSLLKDSEKPVTWPLLQAEMASLWQLDVPRFTARGDSDSLQLTSGHVIAHCFVDSAWNRTRKKIGELNEEDMRWQMSLIVGALDVRSANLWIESPTIAPNEDNDAPTPPAQKEELLAHALSLADGIESKAFRLNNGEIGWMVLHYVPEAERYTLQPMGHDLYNGRAGVGLFFAAIAKILPNSRYRALAEATLMPIRRFVRNATDSELAEFGFGGYAGLSSVVYGLTRAGTFLGAPDLIEDARYAALRIADEEIEQDESLDAIGGAAGAILGLTACYAATGDQKILAKAIACGQSLLRRRETDRFGFRTWPTLDKAHLTGFSHGAAGITYALLKLYNLTEDKEFYHAAMDGLDFETSEFIPEENNWPDYRRADAEASPKPKFAMAWCHGAPGIGLGRVGALDVIDSQNIRHDIDAALTSTARVGLLPRDHLCCGNSGLMDTLCTAGKRLSRESWTRNALQLAARTMARAQREHGFAVAFKNGFFNPGLFQGTAGVGYQMLRLAYPDDIPSVLLLD